MASTGLKVEKIAGPFDLGEGPHWDDEHQALYFVDLLEKTILCFNPDTKKLTKAVLKNGAVTFVVPVAGKKDVFIAGCGTDIVEVNWDPKADNLDPKVKVLASVEAGTTGRRFNDGKVDPMGRLWAGTMGHVGKTHPPFQGSLYRFEHDYSSKKMITPVSISNGLVWSLDNKKFFYIDSPTRQVFAYNYDLKTGDISDKKIIFDFSEKQIPGVPDGMTIDKSGRLWIAVYDGARVIQIDPSSGELLRQVEIPAKEITSVAFGGKNRDILYVTSARQYVKEGTDIEGAQGCLYAVYGLGESGNQMISLKNNLSKN